MPHFLVIYFLFLFLKMVKVNKITYNAVLGYKDLNSWVIFFMLIANTIGTIQVGWNGQDKLSYLLFIRSSDPFTHVFL
jgi:hypothetical protein